MFSSMENGRSANRGKCMYPCRSAFKGEEGEKHFFSMKDMALEEEVLKMPVTSLKIEGRKKTALYVACLLYTSPSTENRELLSLLSKYVKLPCENIQYFASSDSLHEYIAKIFIGRGTKVVIQSPSYDNFRLTAEACGAKVYFSEVDEDFTFNERNFLRDLKKIRPSLVYIVNPNNPLGYYPVSYTHLGRFFPAFFLPLFWQSEQSRCALRRFLRNGWNNK